MQNQAQLYKYKKQDLTRMYDRIQEFLTQIITNVGVARGEHWSGHLKYTRRSLGEARKNCRLLCRELEALLVAYDYYQEQ